MAGVAYVLIAGNVVTIGKKESALWDGLRSEVGAVIRTQIDNGFEAISNIFDHFCRAPLAQFAQSCVGVDSGTVAITPVNLEGVIADARNRPRGHVWAYGLGVEQGPAAHLFDAQCTMAGQPKVPDIEVVAMAVLPKN